MTGADRLPSLAAATTALDPPFAVVDLAAWRANATDLVRRAAGTPIRVASKSVRCRALLSDVLSSKGFRGVLGYTLAEALWLAEGTCDDVVVGYPSVDRAALRTLLTTPARARRVTVMVDDVAHLDLIDAVRRSCGDPDTTVRVCLDLDASLKLAGVTHVGVRRSPLHGVPALRSLAAETAGRKGFSLVGLMAYEAQVAGLPDDVRPRRPGVALRNAVVRRLQAASVTEIAERRAAGVAAVREVADLEFVNGGGTGSVHLTAREAAVTEIAAGSGLMGPSLFDGYRAFTPVPAAYFVLPVVRRPGRGFATVAGGGWIASGPAGRDRWPVPVWPPGLRLTGTEGAGEVQTPLTGRGSRGLAVGDQVWFRHAKAGELSEHVNEFVLLDGDDVVCVTGTVPGYRGEGRVFL